MKAVILAAGSATRLRPLTNNTPKCLLHVAEKKILARSIDNLIDNGLDDIVMVTGFQEKLIREFVNYEYPKIKVQYIYNDLFASTNNIYSLWLVKEALANEEMFLLDSDIIFDKEIIHKLLHSTYDNCLALKIHAVQDEEIKVTADAHKRITDIGKHIFPQEAFGESIGLEKFGKNLSYKLFETLDEFILKKNKVNIFYEAAFQQLIANGESIYLEDVSDHICMEIDTAIDLALANQLLRPKTT